MRPGFEHGTAVRWYVRAAGKLSPSNGRSSETAMLRSGRLCALFAITFCAGYFLPGSGRAQTTKSPGDETALPFTHDFLQAFYPEVFGNGPQLTLCISHPASSTWHQIYGVYFRITPRVPSDVNPLTTLDHTANSDEQANPILLGGFLWIQPERYPRAEQMVASFEIVHHNQLESIRALVESHPDWPNQRAIQALKEAGARYGPAEKGLFVNSLHLEKAEAFLGSLKIRSTEFVDPDPRRAGTFTATAFVWNVEALATFPDGSHETYGLTFEPFEGKLIQITRMAATR